MNNDQWLAYQYQKWITEHDSYELYYWKCQFYNGNAIEQWHR